MTRLLISITLLVLLSVSCGIQSAALQPVAPTGEPAPQPAIFQPQIQAETLKTPTDTPERKLPVSGCWNIRSTSSLGKVTTDDNITRQICGGTVTVTGNMVHGWLQIGESEFVCNKAVQGKEECE